jgi:hypothetical protein
VQLAPLAPLKDCPAFLRHVDLSEKGLWPQRLIPPTLFEFDPWWRDSAWLRLALNFAFEPVNRLFQRLFVHSFCTHVKENSAAMPEKNGRSSRLTPRVLPRVNCDFSVRAVSAGRCPVQ